MKSLLWAVVLVAGCTKPNPDACSDGNCTDPAKPFCDVDGTLGGAPGTCIAVSCTANQFKECQGDRAVTCNAGGNNYDLVACPNGCGDTGCKDPPPMVDAPPCTTLDCMKHIIPRYLPSVCDSLATNANATLDITTDIDLDTDAANACTTVAFQTGGPNICVVHYRNITVEATKRYRPFGSMAIALVADDSLSIKGVLDVSAYADNLAGTGTTIAPAAGYVTSGGAPTTSNAGGGGGNKTAGGSGANTTTDGGGANAGPAQTNPAAVPQLLPGTAPLNTSYVAGGAATLISCRGKVDIAASGLIDAAGYGGEATSSDGSVLPTGGGSGGNVVLQGMAISIEGAMYSNGGGGGGGGVAFQGALGGTKGGRTTAQAPGGVPGTNGGAGGNGGSLIAAATGGKKGSAGGGGGGGSTGYLLTYTPSGVDRTVAGGAVFSPALEANGTVPTN